MEISARLRRWLSAVRPEPEHLRAAAAAATALALPLAVWWLLRANLSVALLLGLTGAVVALQIAAAFVPAAAARPLRWTAATASALFGVSILIGILITPFSSYRLWFAEVHAGEQQGAVSNLFALIAAWAFSSASGVVLSSGFGLAAAVLAVLGLGLAALIVQSTLLNLLTLAAVVLALVVLGSRGVERTGGSVLFAAVIVLLATGVGLLFPRAAGGNYFVDLVLHPRMRGAISATFPRFPLLYSIPGFGTQHEERRLGGTPVLSPLPLLRVYSPQGAHHLPAHRGVRPLRRHHLGVHAGGTGARRRHGALHQLSAAPRKAATRTCRSSCSPTRTTGCRTPSTRSTSASPRTRRSSPSPTTPAASSRRSRSCAACRSRCGAIRSPAFSLRRPTTATCRSRRACPRRSVSWRSRPPKEPRASPNGCAASNAS